MSSKEKSCNSCLCSSIGNYFFLLTYFRIFILIFDFLYMPKCRLFAGEVLRDYFFHSAWCFLSFLGLWSVSDINGDFSVITISNISCLPFSVSFFLVIPYMYVILSVVVPWCLCILSWFWQSSFSAL